MIIAKFKISKYWLILTLFVTISNSNLFGQFYNGHQMDFGKNRVQYTDFVWQFYRYDKYDVYFYYQGKELATYAGYVANKNITAIQNLLGYSIDRRIIFIVYDKLSDFRQSNIGLVTGVNQSNIGGVTKIIDNKVFLYYEGDHKKFEIQIKAAIAEIIINEMLYGNNFRNKLANSVVLALPDWYLKGLISYISNSWDMNIENHVKDGILSRKFEKFNRLSGEDALYAGHSIWNYVAEKYGTSVIGNILYYTKNQKNIESGFYNVLGTPIKYFTNDWLNYYDKKYYNIDIKRELPLSSSKIKFKKNKPNKVFQQIKNSPDNTKIAYVTNIMGKYKIYLYDTLTGKNKKIIRKEHKLEQITDYSYPILAWHPKGDILSFIIEDKGGIWLYFYELSTKELDKRQIFNFDKILDYSYSDNGFNIVMSAVQNGKTDIFNYSIAGSAAEQITNDYYDDFTPRFCENSKAIIFSSDRLKDSLILDNIKIVTRGNTDIFKYDLKNKSKVLSRITNTNKINETNPFELTKHNYLLLSDANGVINRFVAKYDSSISYIDTSIHYGFYTKTSPITNYRRNILEQDVNPTMNTYSELLYSMGKFYPYTNNLNITPNSYKGEFVNSDYRIRLEKIYAKDSINKIKAIEQKQKKIIKDTVINVKVVNIETDSNNININSYVFEKEKRQMIKNLSKNDTNKVKEDLHTPQPRLYMTSFYTNYIVTQVDFGFLNSSYQTFTNGGIYYNPGFNGLIKLGTNDLFEDYKIIGGIRIPWDMSSSEYLISVENLKGRMDKQLILHRQSFTNVVNNSIVKTLTNEGMYILKYPFNQVSAIRATFTLRYDDAVYLATDIQNLLKSNDYKTWSGCKLEYIFDNTIDKGINLYNGFRMKLFSEAFKQIDGSKTDLFVLGSDLRYYQNIHRNLIWASRFAASTSLGKSKLIYYLGSVDNWIQTSRTVEPFNYGIPIDYTKNYAFQTLATDMRGFTQNIRNGNSFALLNNEIRWPIVKYFSRYPVKSDFWSNFQIVAFFDVGTAWTGESPYSNENAYNTDIINNGPITLTIDKNRDPIVYGYGYGVRSKLFGYFIRLDWARGVENGVILPRIFYLSLSLDF